MLPTPKGNRPFRVVAVYYDYSNNRGTVVMDIRTYTKHFSISNNVDDNVGVVLQQTGPSSLNIYLRPFSDPVEVKTRLEHRLAGAHQLIFTTNAAIRNEVMRIFDSTFAITRALELIAIIVAALGVISTLITLILERRRELAILRFLGATKMQIRKMVAIEAITIGGVSQLLGIAIGSMLSLLLIYVVNVQSFGWTIQYDFPVSFLVRSTVLILIVSLLAGLYSAAGAVRVDPVRFAREE
jgi:putative ABC transport system permease protein